MIYTCIPYAPKEHDKDLAWAYNEFMKLLPNDDDWGCFIDHDCMFTTPDWYHQLDEIIKKHPEYSCFTAFTNREYASWQIPEEVNVNNHDIFYHRGIGAKLSEHNYGRVRDVTECSESLLLPEPKAPPRETSPLCGIMILYKKSVWKDVPFRKYYINRDTIFGIDNLIHLDLKKAGHKVGLATGIYLYHWHRADEASGWLPDKLPDKQMDKPLEEQMDKPPSGELKVPKGLEWVKDAHFEEKADNVDMTLQAAQYKISQCKGKNFVIIGVPLPYTREIDLLTCLWVEYQKRKDNMMALYEPTRFASLGRNNVIHKILTHLPDVTHVFFVDKDVLPPVDAIERLLAHDKDVVVGVTPIFKMKPVWSVMKYDPDEKIDNIFNPIPYLELPDKLFRAHHFGATTVLIKRHVLEKMQYPWYQDLFAPGKILLGQDLFFTAKAKHVGFELWCDPNIKCEHARWTEMKTVFDKCLNMYEAELAKTANQPIEAIRENPKLSFPERAAIEKERKELASGKIGN